MNIIGHGASAGAVTSLVAVAFGMAVLASCADDTAASGSSTTVAAATTATDATDASDVEVVEVVDAVDAPAAAGAAVYTINAGDTLSDIADRSGVTVADIVAANGWTDGSGHSIFPGDVITLPPGASAPAPEPAAASGTATSTDAGSTTGTTNGTTTGTTNGSTSSPFDEHGALACDSAAMRAAIGDPDFVTFDEVSCADGWAGAGYLDSENFYTPVIFKAEGERWVLQDWLTVCDLNPDMSEAAKIYCPGG